MASWLAREVTDFRDRELVQGTLSSWFPLDTARLLVSREAEGSQITLSGLLGP